MKYWWPKLKKIRGREVKLPRTQMIDVEMFPDDKDTTIDYNKKELEQAADQLGYPVFIRTDKASAKHKLDDVSKVNLKSNIHAKTYLLAEDNLTKGIYGIHFNSVIVREWLNIKHRFKAFPGNLPIGCEIRAFVQDGKIECKHFYWIRGAIEETSFKPDNWERKLELTGKEAMERCNEVENAIQKIAKEFDGWWSVDAALTENDEWYIIDMAKGEDSFHNPDCPNAPEEIKRKYDND